MSGAEFILVIGVASSILQCVTSGQMALEKLRDIRAGNVICEDTAIQLSSLISVLEDVEHRAKRKVGVPQLPLSALEQSLVRELDGCRGHIDRLTSYITQLTPGEKDKTFIKWAKTTKTIWKTSELVKCQKAIASYRSSLTFRFASMSYTTFPSRTNMDRPPSYSGLLPGAGNTDQTYFCVPSVNVAQFVERPLLYDKIIATLNAEQKSSNVRLAMLLGMGGQGKTQLALKYCREAWAEQRCRGIFWVDASSRAAAVRSFEYIAGLVDPSGKDVEDIDQKIHLVKHRLGTWPSPWIIVLDNYDDPSAFDDIMNFVPPYSNGSVLITSRNKEASMRLAPNSTVQVGGLDADEALELLLSHSLAERIEENVAAATMIVSRLGYHALAIDQGAAYIGSKQLPLTRFLERYERRRRDILEYTPSLWDYKKADLSEYESDRRVSAFTTWDLSLKQVGDEAEQADVMGFLTCVAYLNASHVGESILRQAMVAQDCIGWNTLSVLRLFITDGQWDTVKYEDIIVRLSSLSLIREIDYESDCLGFSLHPLIIDWLRCQARTMEDQLVGPYLLADFFKSYSDNDKSSLYHLPLQQRQELSGHVETCLRSFHSSKAGESPGQGRNKRTLMLYADFFHSQRRYEEAEILFRKALPFPVGSRLEGLDIGTVENRMFVRLWSQLCYKTRKYGDALDGWMALLQYQEKFDQHDAVIDTLSSLAGVCHKRKDYVQAEAYCHRLLALCPDTLAFHHYSNVRLLGEIFHDQGKQQEAELCFAQALEFALKAVGPRHSRIPYYRSFLADAYWSQRLTDPAKVTQAEEIYLECLRSFEEMQGPMFKGTLDTRVKLGRVYLEYREWQKAESMFMLATEGMRKTLGAEHPSTAAAEEILLELKAQQLD